MVVLTWILSIVGVLGVGGAVAAAVLFPAVAIPLLQSIVARIIACRPCLYAVAVIAMCFASWWFGHHQAVLDCRAGELAAQLRNQQIDLDNARKAEADEASRANTIEEKANARQKDDADYIAHLEARPACSLDDSDLGGVPNHKSGTGRKKPPATPK
jgi:hypothetical protein